MHVQDLSTASLNCCSYLTKECSISDEIFITLVDEMQPVSFLDVYCNLQCKKILNVVNEMPTEKKCK